MLIQEEKNATPLLYDKRKRLKKILFSPKREEKRIYMVKLKTTVKANWLQVEDFAHGWETISIPREIKKGYLPLKWSSGVLDG